MKKSLFTIRIIPKIRLEMKDELAMRKKLLAPEAEQELIDKNVAEARRRGLRRMKTALSRSGGDKNSKTKEQFHDS